MRIRKNITNQISRRELIQGIGACSVLVPSITKAQSYQVQIHNRRGANILSDVLSNQMYWEGASKATYTDQYYDEIRLRSQNQGYLALVSGEGKQHFDAQMKDERVQLAELRKQMAAMQAKEDEVVEDKEEDVSEADTTT